MTLPTLIMITGAYDSTVDMDQNRPGPSRTGNTPLHWAIGPGPGNIGHYTVDMDWSYPEPGHTGSTRQGYLLFIHYHIIHKANLDKHKITFCMYYF